MSKRMWLLLNKWKKRYRKENEYETTEQNADGGIDQSVQGQANTGQDAIRQTSTRQYSLSQHTSDTTGQSASGYGTTGQYGKKQGGKELVIRENNTVDERSKLSALNLLTEQPVLHQNAMGLLTEQSLNDDNATRQSAAQPDFDEEPDGVLIDVIAAENIAKKSKCTHTLDTNAIKEAILEAGTLEQFAQRKDAILDVMGRDARILATTDNFLGTNSSRKPECTLTRTVGLMEQGTENEILESLTIVQVATEPNAMEPYSEGPSATNDIEQAAAVPQSTGTSIISTLGLPVIRSSTTKLAIMEQTTIAQTATDPGAIEQTAIEQSVIRPFETEPGAIAQPALEQGAIKPVNREPVSTEQATTNDIGQAADVSLSKQSAITGTLGLPAVRISPTEPSVEGETAVEQPLRQSTTEIGDIGQKFIGQDDMSHETESYKIGTISRYKIGGHETNRFRPG